MCTHRTLILARVAFALVIISGLTWAGRPAAAQALPTAPDGWKPGTNGAAEEWTTATPLALPAEVTFRLRLPVGGVIQARALSTNAADKPLLQADFTQPEANKSRVLAHSSGAPMITWSRERWPVEYYDDLGWGGGYCFVDYAWRFPEVKNLWDESDRADIGAANASLVPLAEKDCYLRLVLAAGMRQIWLDDRLVSEDRIANPAAVQFAVAFSNGARVLAAGTATPRLPRGFVPMPLAHYSSLRHAIAAGDAGTALDLTAPDGRAIPMQAMLKPGADLDLGASLFRYRMTKDAGPNAPYPGSLQCWPDAFTLDPALLTFSAPYREYRNAWLLAWVDGDANEVPRGVFRFYHADAGFCAATEFEISREAMRKGLVKKLATTTADGKALYLVRVPIDSDAYYGFRDPLQRIVDFELSKPIALSRSYPDPIYTGYHPAGLSSSIHVAGITLEESPFSSEVKPHRFAHTFERPDRPGYTVTVASNAAKALQAKVTFETTSYDGQERHRVAGRAAVAPGGTSDVELNLDVAKNGWHELKVTVEAGGAVARYTLSLLMLPPNTRTYGYAANETRFGLWVAGGHTPLRYKQQDGNVQLLDLLHKLGMRRISTSESAFKPDDLQKFCFVPVSGHTFGGTVWDPYFNRAKDPAAWQKALDFDLNANMGATYNRFPETNYCYGGEWGLGGMTIAYSPWPRYTGQGDRELTPEEMKTAREQNDVLGAIGRAIRERYPKTSLYLQWGAPLSTIAHIKGGFPKELVDGYGMDQPIFMMLPERPNIDDSIQCLWELREETKHLGWPRLPIDWCEGPFLPTKPGYLSEREQMDNLVRIYLGALAFGVEKFDCSIQDFDRNDYYGAEHYWSGVYHCRPYMNPKPAAAAVATATAMLCGADIVGSVDTGCLTTYCMAFRKAKTKEMVYALWRIRGAVGATVKVRGGQAAVTDAMGNSRALPVTNGTVKLTLDSSPLWLTDVEGIDGFQFDAPVYADAPAKVTRPLAALTAANWRYDGGEDREYAQTHHAVYRVTDPNLTAAFGQGEAGHPDAAAITLAVEPDDRPLANRYGALVATAPVVIPGKAAALGVWVKGNSSWGRIAFQLRDATGQIWTSAGSKDAWSCDDTFAWSFVNFEGWRYLSFPLPGNTPYDAAREPGTLWWGSRGGDGTVTLPLTLEKIFVEANNETLYLGEMKLIPGRSYKLAGLQAEYASADDASPAATARYNYRRPQPAWNGPNDNPIARLAAEGAGVAPAIGGFTEPLQVRDGRAMHIHFAVQPGMKYNLYLARYDDGRGAEVLAGNIADGQLIGGLRPETTLYLFLTAIGADGKESKPSAPFTLITHDNFLQK